MPVAADASVLPGNITIIPVKGENELANSKAHLYARVGKRNKRAESFQPTLSDIEVGDFFLFADEAGDFPDYAPLTALRIKSETQNETVGFTCLDPNMLDKGNAARARTSDLRKPVVPFTSVRI